MGSVGSQGLSLPCEGLSWGPLAQPVLAPALEMPLGKGPADPGSAGWTNILWGCRAAVGQLSPLPWKQGKGSRWGGDNVLKESPSTKEEN